MSRSPSRLAAAASGSNFVRVFVEAVGQHVSQDFAGERPVRLVHVPLRRRDHVFRRADGNHPAAADAGFRPHVDQPVGSLDDIKVVLDDDHRIPQVGESVQHVEELSYVVEVQPGRRLVQQVQRPASRWPGKFGREFDSLGLAAGHGRGRLTEGHVPETDIDERLQDDTDFRDVAEQFERPFDAEFEHVGDRLVFVADGQGFGVIPLAVADLALDPDVGEEVHFDLLLAVPLARLATAALLVEAEPAGVVAANLALRQAGETVRGSGRTRRCTSPGWTTGRCRSGPGRRG